MTRTTPPRGRRRPLAAAPALASLVLHAAAAAALAALHRAEPLPAAPPERGVEIVWQDNPEDSAPGEEPAAPSAGATEAPGEEATASAPKTAAEAPHPEPPEQDAARTPAPPPPESEPDAVQPPPVPPPPELAQAPIQPPPEPELAQAPAPPPPPEPPSPEPPLADAPELPEPSTPREPVMAEAPAPEAEASPAPVQPPPDRAMAAARTGAETPEIRRAPPPEPARAPDDLPVPPPPPPAPGPPSPRAAPAREAPARSSAAAVRLPLAFPGLGPPAPEQQQAAGGSRATGAVSPPGLLDGVRNPEPEYPLLSRQRGDEGVVTVRLRISETGQVTDVDVIATSGHPALDDSARRAVQRWRFRPAVRDGVPVVGSIRTAVHFRLR